MEQKQATSPRLTVSVKGPGDASPVSKELFMSAGLLRRLVAIAQAVEDITQLYSNPHVQDILIIEIMSPRTPRGEANMTYSLDDFEMSPEDANKIVIWATGHITGFFTNAVENIKTAVMDNGDLKTLMESLNGLSALAEKKLSAGGSTVKSAA